MSKENEYSEIEEYLINKENKLSFSYKDISTIKNKINEKYLTDLSNVNKSIKELNRLKMFLNYQKTKDIDSIKTALDIVYHGVVIGIVIALAEKIFDYFNKCLDSLAWSFFLTLFAILAIALLIFYAISRREIQPSNRKNKNKEVAILAIDEMINDIGNLVE